MSQYYYGTHEFYVWTVEIFYPSIKYKSRIKIDSREHPQACDNIEAYLKKFHIVDKDDIVTFRRRFHRKTYK